MFRNLFVRHRPNPKPRSVQLNVELLEDRLAPAGANLNALIGNFSIQTRNFPPRDGSVLDGVITTGRHTVLRFDITTVNTGDAALDVGRPEDHPEWFVYSVSHGHYHLKDFNYYELLDMNGNLVSPGAKQAFCLMDSFQFDPNAPPRERAYTCEYQGISAGWADVYSSNLPGQFIVIDGVPDGTYRLRATVNAAGLLPETNYGDNSATATIRIKSKKITVLANTGIPTGTTTAGSSEPQAAAPKTIPGHTIVQAAKTSASDPSFRMLVSQVVSEIHDDVWSTHGHKNGSKPSLTEHDLELSCSCH